MNKQSGAASGQITGEFTMAGSLVWESAGAGVGVTAPRTTSVRAHRVRGAGGVRSQPVPVHARRSRSRLSVHAGWRRIAAPLADIFAVALWAAFVPLMMWLGTAAGF
ncbi:MAG TPA: hypothetical protein VF285_01110 [Castellaniella sp.]|uniref:hypothetical protein n=1 Tax=Castellaniella sp. TaxID=1955812 RepID=UPI002F1253CD